MAVALAAMGIELPAPAGDTMLAAYLLDPSQNNYDLARLLEDHIGYNLAVAEEDGLNHLAAACSAVRPLLTALKQNWSRLTSTICIVILNCR